MTALLGLCLIVQPDCPAVVAVLNFNLFVVGVQDETAVVGLRYRVAVLVVLIALIDGKAVGGLANLRQSVAVKLKRVGRPARRLHRLSEVCAVAETVLVKGLLPRHRAAARFLCGG